MYCTSNAVPLDNTRKMSVKCLLILSVKGKVHPKSKLFRDERADENEINTVDRL